EHESSNQYQPTKSRRSQGTSLIHKSKQAREEEHQNR
ncbi:unnamed protein product, partial [Schistosoma mattheei]